MVSHHMTTMQDKTGHQRGSSASHLNSPPPLCVPQPRCGEGGRNNARNYDGNGAIGRASFPIQSRRPHGCYRYCSGRWRPWLQGIPATPHFPEPPLPGEGEGVVGAAGLDGRQDSWNVASDPVYMSRKIRKFRTDKFVT